ncbi:hexokinase A [Ascosphaera acerosa]|nr:hexokinase A [Ascosphaera acerosa]
MIAPSPFRHPQRKGSFEDMPEEILKEIHDLEKLFTVDTALLRKIVAHFAKELEKGLTVEGGNIPMNVTWVLGVPTGHERGSFLALDMGGTNLRVCEIVLTEKKGGFDITQSKYRMPDELKTGTADELWEYIADCIEQFLEYHHPGQDLPDLPLGFTFSYPCTQDFIDHGVLQRWTKGFDIDGVEGHDVVPMFEAALRKRALPIKVAALINDTTGTLIASAYADPGTRIGCIFGTGVNAAYIEHAGNIPKLATYALPPDTPVAINCEYGAFDNERVVLPLTKYDRTIDEESPRPGQQAFEKMTAGLYLGELFRLALLDLLQRGVPLFPGQDHAALRRPYSLDASFLAYIEDDPFENLEETFYLIEKQLNLHARRPELELCRRLAELIGTRAARLSACGIAAICTKKGIDRCNVGADGSVFNKYPHFKERGARALREIFGWPDDEPDRVVAAAAEDGSGVGAALIAALTLERAKKGFLVGIRDTKTIEALGKEEK